jgi:hypothetical protein
LLALAEYRPHGRNCRDQTNYGEGGPNSLPFLSESISEEEGDPCAKKSTGDDNKREFWPGKLDLFHDSTNRLVREDGQTEECRSVARLRPRCRNVAYSRFATFGTTTVPSGSRTTKYIWRIGPLIVSEKQTSQNGTGAARNS